MYHMLYEELPQDMKNYYDNIIYLHCCGDKCRIHAWHGTGHHCNSCFSWLEDDEYEIVQIEKQEPGKFIVVNCYGHGCQNYGGDGKGIHCESCFGEYK